jgi:phage replication-related protein YjqB (UPF0714/DUF867 family)
MPPPYTSYAALAAEQVEGVDYQREHRTPTGWSWLSMAVHGGGIEPGTSEMASEVAGSRMGYYGFIGTKASGNSDLHITSTLVDYPDLLPLLPNARRVLSFHGFAGTAGVAETAVGALDGQLAAAVTSALTAAGFSVIAAPSEIAGSDPGNICSRGLTRAGVQLEMSNALRESFFPGGDLSQSMRDSGQRTSTFHAYAAAVLSAVQYLDLTYDAPDAEVHAAGNSVGLYDTFARTVSGGWGTSDSGHTWTLTGGSPSDFSVGSGVGSISAAGVNVSRWATVPTGQPDFEVTATVSTPVLAAGGSQFFGLAGRQTDPDNTYVARLEFTTAAVVNLTIRKRVAGTETLISSTVNTGLTHVAGTQYAVRFRGSDTTLQAKAWLASDPEPSSWTATVIDTDITTGYRVGVRSILSSANTNPLPVTYSVDDVRTLGPTRLERSLDATTWDTVAGADALPAPPAALSADDPDATGDVPNWYRIRQVDTSSGVVLMEGDQESITPAIVTSGLTLTAAVQNAFPPRVLVELSGLAAAGIASVTLYRQVAGVRTVLRGADGVDVTGDDVLLRTDGEEPFGVPVTYVADLVDGTGARAEVTTGPLTVTCPARFVISDAVTGLGAAVVVQTPLDKARTRDATTMNVGGRYVVISRPRSGFQTTLTVRTETEEDGDALNAVLANATEGVILLRAVPSLPRVDGYLAVPDDTESPTYYDGYTWWELTAVQAEAWPAVLEAAGYTLQDLAGAFPGTLQDINDNFATLLDIAVADLGS